jgi:hypothetical protein
VTTLRAIRRSQSAFDPLFFEKSPLFWPIVRAASAFVVPGAHACDWPEVASYTRVFEAEVPVRFEVAPPLPRRHRRAPIDPGALYDARITEGGCVPTRERSWHDFLNALVWGTFPRSKWALHERQHRAIASRLAPAATRLPGARSRDHDALALIDEGGVVLLGAPGRQVGVIFGHALYEGLVLGVRAMAARVVELQVDAIPTEEDLRGSGPAKPDAKPGEWVRAADEALERRLKGGALVPEGLPRIALAELAAPLR